MVSSPPITMGGVTNFLAENLGGRNFVFSAYGGTQAIGGTSHYHGGTFLFMVENSISMISITSC